MTELTKQDLRDIGMAMLIANTPASLFNQLNRLPAMRVLKTYGGAMLAERYDKLTARATRSEIAVGLAYAVMIAALSIYPIPDLDVSRLEWGAVIKDLVQNTKITDSIFNLSTASPASDIGYTNNPSGLIIL